MTDRRSIGLVGLALFVAALIAAVPVEGLSTTGRYAVATMAYAAVLWVTGAIPLALTALTIPVLLTGFGVYPDLGSAVAGFADPVIFLLLAGFMLAEALRANGIDQRVALAVLARLGSTPSRLVLAVMLVTAGLSMVISNTATAALMAPIAVGLVEQVVGEDPTETNLGIASLLGVAYAASIGGIGTLVGTPPNAIVVGQLRELVGVEITFVQWLAIGLPVVVVTLPVAWFVLVRVAFPPEIEDVSAARRRARRAGDELGPMDPRARRTLVIFGATAVLWLLGGLGGLARGFLPDAWYVTLYGGTGPSVFSSGGHEGLLFYVLVGLAAIPALVLADAADWEDLLAIDWGTLLLLGGGLSLANALSATDATRWLADATLEPLAGVHILLLLIGVVGLIVLVGELASNTAMAAIVAPLLISVGPAYAAALGTTSTTAAVVIAVVGAVAASFGFALPVATPPNAIVYGTGRIKREHMLRAGVPLDVVVILLAAVVMTGLALTVWPTVLG